MKRYAPMPATHEIVFRNQLRSEEDYHDIAYHADLLSEFLGVKVKGYEVDQGDDFCGYYLALYYIGKRPTSRQIKDMRAVWGDDQ